MFQFYTISQKVLKIYLKFINKSSLANIEFYKFNNTMIFQINNTIYLQLPILEFS